jgi:hypothetical protein
MTMEAKYKEIAEWMAEKLKDRPNLYQDQIVVEIKRTFGDEFVHLNDSGNLAIDKKVLAAFRIVTGDSVVWESGEKMWRKRNQFDEKGKRKQE